LKSSRLNDAQKHLRLCLLLFIQFSSEEFIYEIERVAICNNIWYQSRSSHGRNTTCSEGSGQSVLVIVMGENPTSRTLD
jgi:hypothetical protein